MIHSLPYEDSAASIAHNFEKATSKVTKIKHTSMKFFYTHELQKKGIISVKQVQSSDNFTEFL